MLQVMERAFNHRFYRQIQQNFRIQRNCFAKEKQHSFQLKYEKKSPIEHVLLRPGMYVGSMDWMQQSHWILDPHTQRMTKKDVQYSPALLKIFDEILVNAADNVHRQSNLTEIRVKINTQEVLTNPSVPLTISIENDGKSIPLDIHEKEKVYIPELIFGHLLTGSNFDDSMERFTGGSHGYGAKLTNIFSQKFQITIYDAIQNRLYHQYWEKNMSICHPARLYDLTQGKPEISGLNTSRLPNEKSFINVEFQPELERFGLPKLLNNSSEIEKKKFETYLLDMNSLFQRRCYDIAGCLSTVNVYFNDCLLPVQSFRDYTTLFTPPSEALLSNQLSHDSSREGKELESDTTSSSSSIESRDSTPFDYEIPTYRVNDRLEFSVLPMNLVKQTSMEGYRPVNVQNESISFVNNVWTVRGGQHVQYIQAIMADSLLQYLQKHYKKEIESFQKSTTNLLQVIKNQLFFIINCKIENPSFEGQTKDSLLTKANQFAATFTIPSKDLKEFWQFPLVSNTTTTNTTRLPNYYHTQLLQSILQEISFQEHYRVFTSMDKTINTLANSKNKLLLQVPKLDDAHYAGKKSKSTECTLILTEGDSAKALAIAGLSTIGRDYYGVMPLRGKVLNVRAVTSKRQVINNQELMNLCKAMNLQFEKTYETEEEFQSLRYGHLLLMCDQDYDGSHIKGLMINFIHYFWPALLQRSGFLQEFITPIVKVRPLSTSSSVQSPTTTTTTSSLTTNKSKKRGNIKRASSSSSSSTEILSFYNLSEYEAWRQQHLRHPKDYQSYFIKYYKGLGTNSNEEGKEYFQNMALHQKSFQSDGQESHFIDLVFNKDRAKDRKAWLLQSYSPDLFIDFTVSPTHTFPLSNNSSTTVPSGTSSVIESVEEDLTKKYLSVLSYTDFINKELIHFSFSDNVRSIPHLLDGLKPSQRKVLYGSFLKFSSVATKMKEMKVMQLAGFIAEKTSYHHGEQSLHHTIVNMAQQYVGANNVPLLLGIGQFGTRAKGGSDYASPRYIYTKLSPLTRLLFPPEDDLLLHYLEDDGISIEPEYFLPIVPTILLNGSIGIGTGWSTDIPAYSLVEIIDYLLYKLEKETSPPPTTTSAVSAPSPLVPYYHGFKGKIYPDLSTVDASTSLPKAYLSEGTVNIIDRQTIEITELPIMKWTEDYKEFLLKLVEKGDLKSVQEYHTIHSIRFVVKLSHSLQYRHTYQEEPSSSSTSRKKTKKVTKKKVNSKVVDDTTVSTKDKEEEWDGWNHAENHQIWLQYFKLINRINLTNMYAFNPQQQITHYLTPEAMINDFYPIRLQYYQYRQQFVVKSLYSQYFTLQQQQNFLREILMAREQSQNLSAGKKDLTKEFSHSMNLLEILSNSESKEKMVEALQGMGFQTVSELQLQVQQTIRNKYSPEQLHPKLFATNKTSSQAGTNEVMEDSTEDRRGEDEEEEETTTTTTTTTTNTPKTQRQGTDKGGYDYLLQLPIYSFTKDRLSHLEKRIEEIEKKIQVVETTSPAELWRQDLLRCRQKYLEITKTWHFD